jgi:hypothetical protein
MGCGGLAQFQSRFLPIKIALKPPRIHQFAVEFTARRWLCLVAGHFSSSRHASRADLPAATLLVTNFLPSRRPAKEQIELSDTL